MFISGDLFHRQPLMKDLKEVNYLFSTIPAVKVILISRKPRQNPQQLCALKLYLEPQRHLADG